MLNRKSAKSLPALLTLSFIAFIILSVSSMDGHAQTLMMKGVTCVDVSIKKKPGGQLMTYTTDSQGDFSLGNLTAGTYTLGFAPAAPASSANVKSFYESRSNTIRYGIVVDGAVTSPVVTIIDFRQNLALNARTMAFEPLNEITIVVTGEGVVKGKVLSLTIDEPGVK
ncbi:MAG: hypothetical protein IPL01_08950 [Acidobacteria bacterium]|nr:hypothetical protein [Acidobacteriota bacterium]